LEREPGTGRFPFAARGPPRVDKKVDLKDTVTKGPIQKYRGEKKSVKIKKGGSRNRGRKNIFLLGSFPVRKKSKKRLTPPLGT